MKIIVSGGGTGGHIYPALTLIDAIKNKRPDAEFLYVGTEKGLEADIVPKAGINFTALKLEGGLERRFTLENISRAANAVLSIKRASDIVKNFKPDAVVGTGGYVCGPILLAASLMKFPRLFKSKMQLRASRIKFYPNSSIKLLSALVTPLKIFRPKRQLTQAIRFVAKFLPPNVRTGFANSTSLMVSRLF